jgi:uncharacterized coiled-coil DUF342 family protein
MPTARTTEQPPAPPPERPEPFPELRRTFDALRAERDNLAAQVAPLRAERDQLLASIQPTLDRVRELEKQYRAIEQPRLAAIDNQLGALAKAMGGRAMSRPEVVPETEVQ